MLENPRSPRVRAVAKLTKRSARADTGLFLLEGPQAVREALLREEHTRSGAFAMPEVPAITAVTGPADQNPGSAVLADALAIGAELGSGLPGRRIGRLSPSVATYASGVLDLLPDALGPEFERRWGTTPHALAEQTRTGALAATLWPQRTEELGDVIGWLVLGKPIE